jgi:hypothetical protein
VGGCLPPALHPAAKTKAHVATKRRIVVPTGGRIPHPAAADKS